MTATVFVLPGGGIPAGRRVTEGGDGGAWLGCVLRGVGLVDTPVLRDKRGFSLVHCWVSGAALGCSCWALCVDDLFCGCLCVGLCCVRTV